MLFNSFHFVLFFLAIFLLYAASRHRLQNILLLLVSYYFYATWDYRFLALLLLTTSVDYCCALAIAATTSTRRRKSFLGLSIVVNLSVLGFFKYWNFFIDSLADLLSLNGYAPPSLTLKVLAPVGISFYTFKSLSYTVDVYRGKAAPTRSLPDYALFVAFFPQLLAGPIERASQLLNQIVRSRNITWSGLKDGSFYFFWGLFLKVFVADNLARIADPVFAAASGQSGFAYLLAGYAYAFQIYGDFAGYSFMAKGLGGILGFAMMDNFRLPYFAHNPQEFWRRWHISLSTWFRDYLYIPLGGSRGSVIKTMRNLLVTMLLCGLWHGAQFTFVLWGALHGLLLSAHHLLRRLNPGRASEAQGAGPLVHFFRIILFFHLIVLTWYLFRAESMAQVRTIFHALLFNFAFAPQSHLLQIKQLLFYVTPLLVVEVTQFAREADCPVRHCSLPLRCVAYVGLFYLMVIFGMTDAQDFIYMQF
jgi:D-alanyl-lipoteichoic acid acyltransferase DltB (MBOAT superfamily)